MGIKQKFYLILFAVFNVFIIGSVGYYTIFSGDQTLLDCAYFTVISLTTVGYGEVIQITGNPAAQIFTMFLITFGMGIILYGISTLTAILIEGELSDILRKNKMKKTIMKLSSHYILCGGGETGRPLLSELIKNHEPVVLIETEKTLIDRCIDISPDLLYIEGDATEDHNLINAGIEKAAGIIISLPSDKDNLYITMTARMLNTTIRIISRVTNQKIEPKLRKAGADGVVSPNFIGALRMASEMIRPTAVNFLDQMLRSGDGNLRIHDLTISDQSDFSKKTLMASNIKNRFNLLVLGTKTPDGEITFNPPPDYLLEQGTTLILMGDIKNIQRARKTI
ncbi:MAG: potassium channel protein [Desulfobacteraceae bacterium]|nr:potassium channel protein [Desulfobacteraceae bacterium]